MYGLDSRWGFSFLKTDSRMSYEDKSLLLHAATAMYLAEKNELRVKGNRFEGTLYRDGSTMNLGHFVGQHFRAEVDTDHGKADLQFLVSEHTVFSMN